MRRNSKPNGLLLHMACIVARSSVASSELAACNFSSVLQSSPFRSLLDMISLQHLAPIPFSFALLLPFYIIDTLLSVTLCTVLPIIYLCFREARCAKSFCSRLLPLCSISQRFESHIPIVAIFFQSNISFRIVGGVEMCVYARRILRASASRCSFGRRLRSN